MQNQTIYTVSEINRKVRILLEDKMPQIAVKGEISNLMRASSGHCYFTLKDKQAQIRCACFSPYSLQKAVTQSSNGQQIVAYGRLSLYEPRGDYQLIVTSIQDSGLGLLYQQFIELKAKLEQQGFFAQEHKQQIPRFPNHIAIITSPIGAAYHDIINTLDRRYPVASYQLYASEVQGTTAHLQLIDALKRIQEEAQADVIILARGGGSLEDLWAFNHEDLATAIFHCKIPIITGIGHETDFTIADFVADLRASTPSIAAEKATPDKNELLKMIQHHHLSLERCISNQIKQALQRLIWLQKYFEQPEKWMFPAWQHLDNLSKQLEDQIAYYHLKQQQKAQALIHRLALENPELKIKFQRQTVDRLTTLLFKSLENYLHTKIQNLNFLDKHLQHLSPQSTLGRGYAIVNYKGHVIDNVHQLTLGSKLDITLAHGNLSAVVEEIYHE
jgi:exodeoxyribonuclease VII large subunit